MTDDIQFILSKTDRAENTRKIMRVLDCFLTAEFDSMAAVERLFGPEKEAPAVEGHHELRSADPNVIRVDLLTYKNRVDRVGVVYDSPVPVDMAVLAARYGPFRYMVQMKPWSPMPYAFDHEGKYCKGAIIIKVHKGQTNAAEIGFHRYPVF